MDYNDMFRRSKEEAADRLLATKMLDLMDKLRLSNNQHAARRWIWELLQNAKDTGYPDAGVSIIIDLEKKNNQSTLLFKHNGLPFNTQNITFLIQQVSSKDRKQKEGIKKTTGKFGTGFLTTHLLSEKVMVESIIKDGDLPFKKFSILLDRSAREIEDVIISVENSLKAISEALSTSQGVVQFKPSDYNTSFLYQLSKEKVPLAEAGIGDLHRSLPFTLAFSPEIASVHVKHEGIHYHIEGQPQKLSRQIELITIVEKKLSGQPKKMTMAIARGKKTAIAIEIEQTKAGISAKELKKDISRLFCDFPLIGSENFPFPVVINSASFNPNEPRSTVWLTDADDEQIDENRSIMTEAVELYKVLLNFASINKWQHLFHITETQPATETEWLSKDWFDDNILTPIRDTILHTPLIDNPISGRISILSQDNTPQVCFPTSFDPKIRENLWDLGQYYLNDKLPPLEEIHDWSKIIWEECEQITLNTIAAFIQKKEDITTLSSSLSGGNNNVMDWMNAFYITMNLDKSFRDGIINDTYKVIPNQNGVFQYKSYLSIGKKIDEELKNVLKILNVDIRDRLVKEGAYAGSVVEYNLYEPDEMVDQINDLMVNAQVDNQFKYQAADYLISLFCADPSFPTDRREAIYAFCKLFYPDSVSEKKVLTYYHDDIYKEADKLQIREIVRNISECKTVVNLAESYEFTSKKNALKWLRDFVEFLVDNDFESQINLKTLPILPNQNGEFRIKDYLNLDDDEIPEILKDISGLLGKDFRDSLLDITIFLQLPDNRLTAVDDVATEIIQLALPRSMEMPRQEETKNAFRQLYLFFTREPDLSRRLFGDLYANKHKLLDDEEMAANLGKIEAMNHLLAEYKIKNLGELRKLLQYSQRQIPQIEEKEPITKELLASWGITSKEEYKKLIGPDVSSNMFQHISTATPEMFRFAKEKRERARKNIIRHLKTLPEYVFEEDDLDEIAPTVIGGITKDGLSINVVFRPSDNGEVIFYYPSEKATLDLPNTELWIDDGKNTPSILTLGRILTTTGINRIPIK